MFKVLGRSVEERRSAPRQVAYRLDVVAENGAIGCLLDVSSTGMRVRFKRGVDVSLLQALRLEFPRWLELGSGLEVRGRFVWLRSTEGATTEAGFAFDELGRKERGVLQVLIQRLGAAIAEDRAVG